MDSLILKEYLGKELIFTEDGWINATQVAKQLGKNGLENFMRSKSFTEHKKAFCKIHRTKESEVIRVKQAGNAKEQGTYLHPKLAIEFARWISPEFAVRCNDIIFKILTGELEVKYKQLQKEKEDLEDKAFDRYELIKLFSRP